MEKLPFVALGVVAMAFTVAAQRDIGAVTSAAALALAASDRQCATSRT